MASKSIVMSPGGAAAQTISRAAATAFGIWRSSSEAVAFTALQAVDDRGDVSEQLGLLPQRFEVAEAVGPIGDGDGEMGEHDARVVGVPRDAAVGHRLRHRPASARCDRPAQHNNAVPACETRFLPSVVTSARRTERLRCTFKEASSWVDMTVLEHSHSPS